MISGWSVTSMTPGRDGPGVWKRWPRSRRTWESPSAAAAASTSRCSDIAARPRPGREVVAPGRRVQHRRLVLAYAEPRRARAARTASASGRRSASLRGISVLGRGTGVPVLLAVDLRHLGRRRRDQVPGLDAAPSHHRDPPRRELAGLPLGPAHRLRRVPVEALHDQLVGAPAVPLLELGVGDQHPGRAEHVVPLTRPDHDRPRPRRGPVAVVEDPPDRLAARGDDGAAPRRRPAACRWRSDRRSSRSTRDPGRSPARRRRTTRAAAPGRRRPARRPARGGPRWISPGPPPPGRTLSRWRSPTTSLGSRSRQADANAQTPGVVQVVDAPSPTTPGGRRDRAGSGTRRCRRRAPRPRGRCPGRAAADPSRVGRVGRRGSRRRGRCRGRRAPDRPGPPCAAAV